MQAATALIADTATERGLDFSAVRLVAFLATASRRGASGNNDRLSTLWREVISLASVARSFSKSMVQSISGSGTAMALLRLRVLIERYKMA
jgi:hypothetical protein